MQAINENLDPSNIPIEPKINTLSSIISWIKFILLLLVVIFIFRFAFGITIIDGNSMNPTLENNDMILTSNIFYTAERNDIVIVKNPSAYNIIKRIIALPGEKVKISDGIVYVNGIQVKESYTVGTSHDIPETILEKDFYFIIGDNRTPGESLDSRSPEIGPISKTQIIGEMILSPFHF
jgi:signal peptidase I